MRNVRPSDPQDLEPFTDAAAAVARIAALYDEAVAKLKDRFEAFVAGDTTSPVPVATYPSVAITVEPSAVRLVDTMDAKGRSFGNVPGPGRYGTTVTRPDLFADYFREQIGLLLENTGQPIMVGRSRREIPLTFAIEDATARLSADQLPALQALFRLPNLADIDDNIANGTVGAPADATRPLALFTAERIDLSLMRLAHYTATGAQHFQRFILFTNYQRYVDEFIAYGHAQMQNGSEYLGFVEPGEVIAANPTHGKMTSGGTHPKHLPQMPAYHLIGENHEGITLINIGVGPSNAKTITDHVAVLRPHCWLMVGHCGGLRRSQRLGDYALAHAYVRDDHVLDADLPAWVPLPAIAEVQVAMSAATQEVTGFRDTELKRHLRTGTVYTTDDRDWELRHAEMARRFNQSRAIAIDMESATIAANGFRFRVPYGTLLCVSDKPLHGEIKLRGMANQFYTERVGQHLHIGVETLRRLREEGVNRLHSRKLRSFDEPPFR